MVQIKVGKSWTSNPSYVASFLSHFASQDLPQGSIEKSGLQLAESIQDLFSIEVDGADLCFGLPETSIFLAVDRLAKLLISLCRGNAKAGQISLSESSIELILARDGPNVAIALLTLSRPPRLLSRELVVDLRDLAKATIACAVSMLADAGRINGAVTRIPFFQKFSSRCKNLARAMQMLPEDEFSSRRSESSGEHIINTGHKSSCQNGKTCANSPAGAFPIDISVSFPDESKRLSSFSKGAELYSLLGSGEIKIFFKGVTEPVALQQAPPFLTLKELQNHAKYIVNAFEHGEKEWDAPLWHKGPVLRLDMRSNSARIGANHQIECHPLSLAKQFSNAVIDFATLAVDRCSAQSSNSYLTELAQSAGDLLNHIREIEKEDFFASDTLDAEKKRDRPGSPISAGDLKIIRFKVAWQGVDTGFAANAIHLLKDKAITVSRKQICFLKARSGVVCASYSGDNAVFSRDNGLVFEGSRALGIGSSGRPRFLRDLPDYRFFNFEQAANTDTFPPNQFATLCIADGNSLVAFLNSTGRIAWRFNSPGASRIATFISKNRIYVATNNGFFYSLDAERGSIIFRIRAGHYLHGNITVTHSYIASLGHVDGNMHLMVVDRRHGYPSHKSTLPLDAAFSVVPWGPNFCIGGIRNNKPAIALLTPLGQELFCADIDLDSASFTMKIHAGRLYCSSINGAIICIMPNGRVLWRSPGGSTPLYKPIEPIISRRILIAAGEPIRAMAIETGKVLCELPADHGVSALAANRKLDLFVIDDEGVASRFRLMAHFSLV